MDSQFNSLLQSYNSNFVQHKVTGNPSYQQSYLAAKKGLDEIVSSLEADVSKEKQQISDFYKSGIEDRMIEMEQSNRKLQRGIVKETDDYVAATRRNEHGTSFVQSISTSQYVSVGILSIIAMALSFL
jgi:CHASE3 domain sensor protein